ncbi:MAG: Gfo/Idh/MocA family oxidoreductase [Victivallaceae bacterium]|nr:Gfo/Idh/MocA family oxidoreductase [Victivallaceae bacterium]
MKHHIGVIGFGVWGCHSLERELLATGRAVVDKMFTAPELGDNCFGENLAEEQRRYAEGCGATVVSRVDEIFNDPLIDIVSVMTAPKYKPAMLAKAVAHQKLVVTDKPLAMSAAEVEQLAAQDGFDPNRIFVLAGYWNRPGVAKLVEAVQGGRLGRVLDVTVRLAFMGGVFPGFVPTASWRSEIPSAEMTTIGSHAILTARRLLNTEITDVYARRRNMFYPEYQQVDAEDWCEINLRCASTGAIGNIVAARLPHRVPGEDITVEVTGERGYGRYASGKLELYADDTGNKETPELPNFCLSDTFNALLDDWESKRPISVNFNAALELQKTLDACQKSADVKQVVHVEK